MVDEGAGARMMAPVSRWFAAGERTEAWTIPILLVAAAVVFLLPLLMPGTTYTAKYVNDVLMFLETADRVVDGQVLNRDVHAALGPLTYVFPAFGWWFKGLGGMMPWASAAFTLMLLPLLIYVCRTRLPFAYAIGFGLYILLLVIAPVNVGEAVNDSSFAMFYNRWGYAALSLLFLLVLPRKPGSGKLWLDMAMAAAFLLIMFYLKISYFAVGVVLAMLAGGLKDRRLWLAALCLTALAIVAIDLFWSGTAGYLADIRNAAQVNGTLRGDVIAFVFLLLSNIAACALFAFVIGLAILRGVPARVMVLCLAMGGAGILLINQNAQIQGVVTFIPAALVAMLTPGTREARFGPVWPRITATLLIAALLLPIATTSAVVLAQFFVRSRSSSGDFVRLQGLVTDEGIEEPFRSALTRQRQGFASGDPSLASFTEGKYLRYKQAFAQSEYLLTIRDGMNLLRDRRLGGTTYVLDMGNPFNALLGRRAPTGVDAWNHSGRTMTETQHIAPEVMFADVDVVMVPKLPSDLTTRDLLLRVYGPYLGSRFEKAASSDYWLAYRRKEA